MRRIMSRSSANGGRVARLRSKLLPSRRRVTRMSPMLGMASGPDRQRFAPGREALESTYSARPRACPSGGVRAGGGRGWSVDRATYAERIQVPPYGRLPRHHVVFEAYLRHLAMHLVWCRCRSRLASPLLGGIATAVGSPAQGVLKTLSVASYRDGSAALSNESPRLLRGPSESATRQGRPVECRACVRGRTGWVFHLGLAHIRGVEVSATVSFLTPDPAKTARSYSARLGESGACAGLVVVAPAADAGRAERISLKAPIGRG
jgi:hypothetical protein